MPKLLSASLAILVLTIASACRFWRKPPTDRPGLVNPALDHKLGMLLRFDVPQIGADSLYTLNGADNLLLDARAAEEYAVSHIEGAIRIDPDGKLPAWIADIEPERQVTVYCSVGYRSENVGRRLQAAGFTKVSNLYGSLFDWVDRGYPLVDSSGNVTRRIHTYNARWGELVTHPEAQKIW